MRVHFTVPSGRRGVSQMISVVIKSTGAMAKVRAFMEQTIRHLKIFGIISNKWQLHFFSYFLLIECGVSCNLKRSMYSE